MSINNYNFASCHDNCVDLCLKKKRNIAYKEEEREMLTSSEQIKAPEEFDIFEPSGIDRRLLNI